MTSVTLKWSIPLAFFACCFVCRFFFARLKIHFLNHLDIFPSKALFCSDCCHIAISSKLLQLLSFYSHFIRFAMRTHCSRVLQDTLFDVGTQIFGQKYYRKQTSSVGSLLIRCVGFVFVSNILTCVNYL